MARLCIRLEFPISTNPQIHRYVSVEVPFSVYHDVTETVAFVDSGVGCGWLCARHPVSEPGVAVS
eukprot:1289303-Rhodomonas_salina.1